MAGVEILAIEEVTRTGCTNGGLVALMFMALCSIVVGILWHSSFYDYWGVLIGIVMGAVLGGATGVIIDSINGPAPDEIHYKVTVSDEVPLNEFLSRYEIIDVEGKIYTVKEVENGEN